MAPFSNHLVFFIHGVGQQEGEYGNMSHHVTTIQNNTNEILHSQYPSQHVRVKYVPIEWHSVVHARVDAKMDQSTLHTVPRVRLATNHWLMDSLYYFSKPYGQCITDTVCEQCQQAYDDHVQTNPDFKLHGQVHFIGFSLGGVIAYDIAAMQWKDTPAPWENVSEKEDVCRYTHLKIPLLDFKVSFLFTCGSPIAATLISRGLDYKYYRPPPHTQLFNIFHPFDPLGYRIEPMVNEAYSKIGPVRLRRAERRRILPKIPDLGIRSSIAGAAPMIMKARQSLWQYVMADKSNSLDGADATLQDACRCETKARALSRLCQCASVDPLAGLSDEPDADCGSSISSYVTATGPEIDCHLDVDRFDEKGAFVAATEDVVLGCDGETYPRTDYVFTENVIDAYASEWIVALKSHFRYWANRDLALHIAATLASAP